MYVYSLHVCCFIMCEINILDIINVAIIFMLLLM